MEYFQEPVIIVFFRDMTKEVNNYALRAKNERSKEKLKKMRYSNQNLAQEMRTPLGSIIIVIDMLLKWAHTVPTAE